MKFAAAHKLLSFVLAGVAATPLMFSMEVGIEWSVLFALLFLGGWWLEAPLTRNPGYRPRIVAVVIIILALQLIRLVVIGTPMARLGMEFSLVLLGVKLCSRGWSADYQQITILSFLQIIASTIALDDLSYAISFVAFLVLSPPMLILTHLRSEMEKRFGTSKRIDARSTLERLFNSKRIITWRTLVSATLLSGPVLLITALLFVSFPRLGFGFLGRLPRSENAVGFTDRMTLGDMDLLRTEETVLIRLEPLEQQELTQKGRGRPDHLPIRLRGAVFDTYQNRTWRQQQKQWTRAAGRRGVYRLTPDATRRSIGYEVLLESIDPPVLFIPEGTAEIVTYPIASGGTMRARRLQRNALGMLRYHDKAKVGLQYRVYHSGAPPFGDPPGPDNDYLQLPPNASRLARLAQTYAGQGSRSQQITRVIRGLRQDYRYATRLADDPRNALAATPLDRFLFARKTGTCEHFATALTLMLRTIGIPARAASGFSGADWNTVGQFYAVRKRFAHSWTEAYLNQAWQTFDATPAAEGAMVRRKPPAITLALDALRMRWHKYIIGYDAASQISLLSNIKRFAEKNRLVNIGNRPPLLWLLAIPPVMLLFWLAIKWARRNRIRFRRHAGHGSSRRSLTIATKLYHRLDRRLTRLGHPRAPMSTPLEHLDIIRQVDPLLADRLALITARYNAVRFGSEQLPLEEANRLKAAIDTLSSQTDRPDAPTESRRVGGRH